METAKEFNDDIPVPQGRRLERIRLDCESGANHNLNRLLDKPGIAV